jgi:hypothetical protein
MNMKNYIVILILSIISLIAQAQSELVIKGTKKITKKMTPQQVIDSLEARFPNARSVNYYKVATTAAKNGWQVTAEDNLEAGAEVELYTISFKRDDFKYYGLYKADGTLLRSKYEEKDVDLPEQVVQSIKTIASQYPGFKVTGKTHFKRYDYSKNTEYYEITAKKGKETKRLVFAPDGTLQNVKG